MIHRAREPVSPAPSSQSEELDNYFRTDFNTIWNGLSEPLQVRLHIRNLFDKENNLSNVWNMPNGATPDEERNVTIALSYDFF